MIRMCLTTLLIYISLATVSALAETFDYQGSAIIDCVCPAPFGGSDCGVPKYQKLKYSLRVAVSPGLDSGSILFAIDCQRGLRIHHLARSSHPARRR